jgi:hypothetical protein
MERIMAQKDNSRTAGPHEPRLRGYANKAEVDPADESLLDTPAGRDDKPDPEQVRPNTPEAEGAPRKDVGSKPRGDETGHVGPGNEEETPDGLDETEEAVRREAEDRPTGRRVRPPR